MKKIIAFLCIIILLSGCAPKPILETEVSFQANNIRTNGYHEDLSYPAIRIMRSVDDLASYYENYKEIYDFAGDSFIDAINKYDTAYFEDRILLMVLLEEPSGSNTHRVTDLMKTSYGETVIVVERIVPEMGTDDMAEWHLFIEPEAGFTVPENPLFRLVLDKKEYPLYERVEFSKGAVNMSLNKLPGWRYEIIDQQENFGIRFHPAAEPEGHITLWYQTRGFGVCGTGLSTETRAVGKWEASQGTYDENEDWFYIYLTDAPGDYVFLTEGDISWREKYEAEIETIISTALIAQNCVSKNRIREIAELYDDELGITYDDYTMGFDPVTGLWTIEYQKDSQSIHTLQIRAHGAIVE